MELCGINVEFFFTFREFNKIVFIRVGICICDTLFGSGGMNRVHCLGESRNFVTNVLSTYIHPRKCVYVERIDRCNVRKLKIRRSMK